MKTIIIAIICCLCFVCNANATTAASCSLADVRTAVTETARGGTVIVPAGSCNWNDTLTVTKAITIQGAGSESTLITSTFEANGKVPGYPFIRYYPTISDASYVFRVTGFGFDAVSYTAMFRVDNSYSTFTAQIELDNNRYINCYRKADSPSTEPYETRWSHTMNLLGLVKGVIHNNYFSGMPVLQTRRGGTAWKTTVTSWDNGTDNNIFWENNYFYHNNSYNQIIVAGSGGSNVIRYNTFDYTLRGSSYFYATDAHGAQYNNYYGAFGTEIYGNKFIGAGYHEITMSRGGYNKVFYNKTVGAVKPAVVIWETYGSIYANVPTGHACPVGSHYYGTSTCSPDGRGQNVEKSYFWNNRYSTSGAGSEITYTAKCGGEAYPACDPTGVAGPKALVEDTHYWVRKTFDGTSGVGCGTLAARPATCTKGVGYWATNQSCDTIPEGSYGISVSAANQLSGALYTCTATNTWTKTYEPYTYPHPYRDDADVSPPQYVTGTATPSGEQACPSNPTNVTVGFTVTDQTPSGVVCKGCNSGESCTSASTYAEIAAMAGVISFASSCSGTSCAQTATNSSACDSAKLVYARCTDGTNVMTSSVVIPYTMADDSDTDAPTITGKEVLANGTTLRLTFSEAVQAGVEETTGFTFSRTRGETPGNVTVTCTDPFSNVTTIDCQLASTVYSTDTDTTLAYTQAGNEIEDMAGNDLASIAEPVAVTNSSTQTGTSATSLWNHSDTPSLTSYPWSAATVGTRWKSSAAGQVSQLCFYKHADMDAEEPHTAGIWNDSGTLLGSVTWGAEEETESGWQCKALSANADINANEYYTIGVYCPSRRVHTSNYFAQDYTNSTFTAGTENGVHTYGESLARPTTSSSTDRNWWVDFVFVPTGSGQWAVAVSKTGDGCTITDSVIVADTETGEATVTVNNGWAVSIGGTCPAGSGVLTGNSYVWTTGSITEDCTVVATCVEIQLVPWVAP